MKRNQIAIRFEIDYLDSLVNAENACVEIDDHTYHLALHPFHLNNINESIKDILNNGIAKFDKKLNGILLGYKNVKLVSDIGTIAYDSCFIHVDISASFYMFKPQVGKYLQGLVNKKSEDHIGCLVHNTFNVSLPRPEGGDDDDDSDNNEWLGLQAEIGSEILCKITFINLEARLPYIRAELVSILREPVSGSIIDEEITSPETNINSKKIIFESDNEQDLDSSKIKKTKKKKKIKNEHVEQDSDEEEPINKRKRKHSERESDEFEVIKKKKKHKYKEEAEELENGNDSKIKTKKSEKDEDEFESINSSNLKTLKIKKEVVDDSLEDLAEAALQRALLRVSDDAVKKEKRKSKKVKADLSENVDSDASLPELNLDRLFEANQNGRMNDDFVMADNEDKRIKRRRKSMSVSVDKVLKNELLSDSDLERLCTDVDSGKKKPAWSRHKSTSSDDFVIPTKKKKRIKVQK